MFSSIGYLDVLKQEAGIQAKKKVLTSVAYNRYVAVAKALTSEKWLPINYILILEFKINVK